MDGQPANNNASAYFTPNMDQIWAWAEHLQAQHCNNEDGEEQDPLQHAASEWWANKAFQRMICTPHTGGNPAIDVDKAMLLVMAKFLQPVVGAFGSQVSVSALPTHHSTLGTNKFPNAVPFCIAKGSQVYISSNVKEEVMEHLQAQDHVYLDPSPAKTIFANPVVGTLLSTSAGTVFNAVQSSGVDRILTHQYGGKVPARKFLIGAGVGCFPNIHSDQLFSTDLLVQGAEHQVDIGFHFEHPDGTGNLLLLGLDQAILQHSDKWVYSVNPQLGVMGEGMGGLQLQRKQQMPVSCQLDPEHYIDIELERNFEHDGIGFWFQIEKATIYMSGLHCEFQQRWGKGATSGKPKSLVLARQMKAKAHQIVSEWQANKVNLLGGRVELTVNVIGARALRNVCGYGDH